MTTRKKSLGLSRVERFHLPGVAWRYALCACLACALPVGCAPKIPSAQVSGTITYEGDPVPAGVVMFENSAAGIYMTAKLLDGRFELATAGKTGIPPGSYRVAVSPPVVDHPIGPILERPKLTADPFIPNRYHDVETSDLTAELHDGDNLLTFDLTKRK